MKKGFTLIELIITIGLLAIIGIVIATNMNGIFLNQQDEQYKNFKKVLENASCTYIDSNAAKTIKTNCKSAGSCNVKIKDLLTAGLIKEEDRYNPQTKTQDSLEKIITISYQNGRKSCTYNE